MAAPDQERTRQAQQLELELVRVLRGHDASPPIALTALAHCLARVVVAAAPGDPEGASQLMRCVASAARDTMEKMQAGPAVRLRTMPPAGQA